MLLIGIGIACLGFLIAWNCNDGRRTRASVLAVLRGYSGCRCDDCVRGILGVAPPDRRPFFDGPGVLPSGIAATLLGASLTWIAVRRPRVFLRIAMRRVTRPGLCANCGYSLTGLQPNSKCPECGHLETPTRRAEQ